MAGKKCEDLFCSYLEMHLFAICCHFFTLELICFRLLVLISFKTLAKGLSAVLQLRLQVGGLLSFFNWERKWVTSWKTSLS